MRSRLEQRLKAQFQESAHLGPNPAPLHVCCVALGKSHNPAVPQWPHPQRRLLVCTRGIIAILVAVVVSPREGYRAFLASPGTPLSPLGRVSLLGDLSTMGLTMMRSGVSSGTPSAQHGSRRAEAGAGRKRAGGQCSTLELARNRGLSWSLLAEGCREPGWCLTAWFLVQRPKFLGFSQTRTLDWTPSPARFCVSCCCRHTSLSSVVY